MNNLQHAADTLNNYEQYGTQAALDASLASASFHQNAAGVNNPNNTSTIEQQLDLKYKQYSTSIGGAAAVNLLGGAPLPS